jgi:hypothetical protein
MDILDIVKRNLSVMYVGNFRHCENRLQLAGQRIEQVGSSWLSDGCFLIDRGKSVVPSASIRPSIGGSPLLQFTVSRPTSKLALTAQLDNAQTSSDHR